MTSMDRVHYAGGSILTGSDIADALVDYAEALAQAGSAGTAVIPIVTENGELSESHLLVGPSSQILTVREKCDTPDPIDEEWVRGHHRKADELRRHGVPAPSAGPAPPPSFAEQWIAEL